MKIRKLVAATEVDTEIRESDCSISKHEDYENAIDCIKCAIEALSHAAKCDNDDVVAKDSIANLAVVLFDLKGSIDVPEEEKVAEEVIEEEV